MAQYVVGLTLEEQRRAHPRPISDILRSFTYVTVIGQVDNPYVRVAIPEERASEFSRALPNYVFVEPFDRLDLL